MQWPPPNYYPDRGTGYKLAPEHLHRLVSKLEYRSVIVPMLRIWFGYEIVGTGTNTVVRAPDRARVSLDVLHDQIQSDPKKQYCLYQRAMDFWR